MYSVHSSRCSKRTKFPLPVVPYIAAMVPKAPMHVLDPTQAHSGSGNVHAP